MSLTVVLTVAARRDVLRVREWYESQQPGLGDRFSAELDSTLTAVSDRAASFPVAHGDMRKASLDRFPYGVFFVVEAQRVVVLGVIDLRRHPRTWRRIGGK